jgi:hypothetical protein
LIAIYSLLAITMMGKHAIRNAGTRPEVMNHGASLRSFSIAAAAMASPDVKAFNRTGFRVPPAPAVYQPMSGA